MTFSTVSETMSPVSHSIPLMWSMRVCVCVHNMPKRNKKMSKTTSGDMYVFLSLLLFWDDRRCGACMFLRVEVTALCLNVCGCECVCVGVCVCVFV